SIDRKIGLKKFIDFVAGSPLVAHNLKYDIEILKSNLDKVGLNNNLKKTNYDTVELTKRIFPALPKYKLEFLLAYLKIEGVNYHNAIDDVIATCNLITSIEREIEKTIIKQNAFIKENSHTINTFKERFGSIYLRHQSKLKSDIN